MLYTQLRIERNQLLVCTLISGLLLALMGTLLSGCGSRKSKDSTRPTVIYADTNRVKLVHRADSSGKALTIIQQRTQSTVTTYGQSVQQFDSIQFTLP